MFARLTLVVVLLAVIFGGIFGWKYHTAQQMAAAQAGGPPPAAIAATTVKQENWRPYIQVVGSLSAVAGIEVSSEVGGLVSAIHFNSGEQVTKGKLLLELDDETDQAALKGLEAERRLALLKYQRAAQLIKDKSVSKSDFDEARATLDNTSAQVESQRALLEKKKIRAPFDGRLGIRRVDLGEYLTPGAAIVPLEQLDPIYADFTLPERELSRIAEGQTIAVQVQAYPDRRFEGHIIAIDPGIQIGSRSFRVRAQLENADSSLRPGMFADVRVMMPTEDSVITIPGEAISYAPYGDSVFLIEEKDGKKVVSRRQIQTGNTRNGRVEVVSGLQVGDEIVSAGHNKLRNGQPVVVDDKPAPSERAPGA